MIYTFIAFPPTTTVLKVHVSEMEKWVFLHFMPFRLCKTCLISRNLLLMHPGLTDICTISTFFAFPPSTHHLQGIYFDDENKCTTFTLSNQNNFLTMQFFPLMTNHCG